MKHYNEAFYSDPEREKMIVALVDGNNNKTQLRLLKQL